MHVHYTLVGDLPVGRYNQLLKQLLALSNVHLFCLFCCFMS